MRKVHRGLSKPQYNTIDGTVKEASIWWMRFSCRGCPIHPQGGGRHKESTHTELVTEAQRKLDHAKGAIASGKWHMPRIDRVTVRDILDSVVSDYANKKRKSLDSVKRKIEKHLIPYFGHRSAVSITGADVRAFTDQRLKAKAAPAEINRELAALRRAYVLAVKDGKLPSRPSFELLPENNQRKGFFTEAEVTTLCTFLPEDFQDAVRFLFITGWRIMETLSREWRHVDFDRGTIQLEHDETKNKQSRIFPFTKYLSAMLTARKRKTDTIQKAKGRIIPYVFHVNGSPLFTAGKPVKEFSKAWKLACKQAGLAGRVPHDFRRSAAMNLITAGVDEQTAMDLLGHRTPSIFRRYRIVTDFDRFEAVKKLDSRKKSSKEIAK